MKGLSKDLDNHNHDFIQVTQHIYLADIKDRYIYTLYLNVKPITVTQFNSDVDLKI